MSVGSLIDAVIGLSLFFGVLSLCSSAMVELWATLLDRRAVQLQAQLQNMLGEDLLDELMAHPLVLGIKEDSTLPSYMEPAIFRQALLDLARKDMPNLPPSPSAADWITGLNVALQASDLDAGRERLLNVLRGLLQHEAGEATSLHTLIETWFQQCMQRASAWYKRNSQLGLFCASSVLVVALNADALENFNVISTNPALRAALLEHASQLVKERSEANRSSASEISAPTDAGTSGVSADQSQLKDTRTLLAETQQALGDYGFLVGWSHQRWEACGAVSLSCWPSFSEGVLKVFGLLISILAASLGADFWFSMISRLLPLRSVGRSPDEQPTNVMSTQGSVK